jgi:hypothetical protein
MKLTILLLALFCIMAWCPLIATAQPTHKVLDKQPERRVSVSGRVFTPGKRPIKNATVILTDTDGLRRTVVTNRSGAFIFYQINTGETYVLGVVAKDYRFASRVINVTGRLGGLTFTGMN